MAIRREVVVVCLTTTVFVLVACSPSHRSSPTAAPRPTTSATNVPTSATAPPTSLILNPKVSVTPSTGLHDGQAVMVTVTGFVPGKVFLSECTSAAAVNKAGCGNQLSGQPFVATEEDGSGSVTFTVAAMASVKPYDSSVMTRCRSSCVLVGTVGLDGEAVASTPLSFE